MKNSIFTVLAALVLYPAGAQPVTPQDRRRAAELVERMTLDEKIGQLVQQRGRVKGLHPLDGKGQAPLPGPAA